MKKKLHYILYIISIIQFTTTITMEEIEQQNVLSPQLKSYKINKESNTFIKEIEEIIKDIQIKINEIAKTGKIIYIPEKIKLDYGILNEKIEKLIGEIENSAKKDSVHNKANNILDVMNIISNKIIQPLEDLEFNIERLFGYNEIEDLKTRSLLLEYLKRLLRFSTVHDTNDNYKKQLNELLLSESEDTDCNKYVIKLLIEEGADINVQDKYGRTALINVLSIPNKNAIDNAIYLAMIKGADIHIQDKDGYNALMLLIGYRPQNILDINRITLRGLADLVDIAIFDPANADKTTTLGNKIKYAIRRTIYPIYKISDMISIISNIISYGSMLIQMPIPNSIYAGITKGYNVMGMLDEGLEAYFHKLFALALNDSIIKSFTKDKKQLIIDRMQELKDLKQPPNNLIYNKITKSKITPQVNDIDKHLIIIDSKKSSFNEALYAKDAVTLLNFLVEQSSDDQLNAINRLGQTALIIAVATDKKRFIGLPDNYTRWTNPRTSRSEVIKLLLDRNINLDIQDKWGNNALMIAAYNGQRSIVEYLIDHNAQIDLINKTALNALAIARIGYFSLNLTRSISNSRNHLIRNIMDEDNPNRSKGDTVKDQLIYEINKFAIDTIKTIEDLVEWFIESDPDILDYQYETPHVYKGLETVNYTQTIEELLEKYDNKKDLIIYSDIKAKKDEKSIIKAIINAMEKLHGHSPDESQTE